MTGPRIIVHAGFHKTGTSSLQSFLDDNRKTLDPHLRIYRRRHFPAVAKATDRVALRPYFGLSRFRFRRALAQVLRGIDGGDPRPVVLSWEGFSGTIPGFGGVTDYRVAPDLAADTSTALRARFGAGAALSFLYTTRAREPWLESAYRHHVKYHPLTDGFDRFASGLARAPAFADTLAAIRARVAPVPVVDAALEDLATARFGPGSAILPLLDLPPAVIDALRPVPAQNRSEGGAKTAAYLDMNRAGGDRATLRRAKRPNLRGQA